MSPALALDQEGDDEQDGQAGEDERVEHGELLEVDDQVATGTTISGQAPAMLRSPGP
jgi:hypothetical protein